MKKKTVMMFLCVTLLSISAAGLTGCGEKESNTSNGTRNTEYLGETEKSKEAEDPDTTKESKNTEETENPADSEEKDESQYYADILNDNANYFFVIDGQKFSAGDKIADLSSVGYELKSSELEEELPGQKYMIGAGHMINEDGNSPFTVVPYNDTDETITLADAVIGGISFSASDLKRDERVADFEVYGGIKIGATEEEVKAAFGEPTSLVEGEFDGKSYSVYYYESDETYRSYKIRFDDEMKVKDIEWKNLVYNQ